MTSKGGDSIKDICAAFANLEKDGVKSLLFVYSGHNDKDKGLKVGGETHLTREELLKFINYKSDEGHEKKYVFFLDCCYCFSLTDNRRVMQFNACGPGEKAHFEEESIYLRFVRQALTTEANGEGCKTDCKPCKTFKDEKFFIRFDALDKYLREHVSDCRKSMTPAAEKRFPVDGIEDIVAFKWYPKITVHLSFECKGGRVRRFEIPKSSVMKVDPTSTTIYAETFRLIREKLGIWGYVNDRYSETLCFKTGGKVEGRAIDIIEAWLATGHIECDIKKMDDLEEGRMAYYLPDAPVYFDALVLTRPDDNRDTLTGPERKIVINEGVLEVEGNLEKDPRVCKEYKKFFKQLKTVIERLAKNGKKLQLVFPIVETGANTGGIVSDFVVFEILQSPVNES